MALIVVVSWWAGDFSPGQWMTARRVMNLQRFLGELRPWPLQQENSQWSDVWPWAANLWHGQGQEAALTTLAISLVAIVLAGIFGAVLSVFAARNIARAEPILPGGKHPGKVQVFIWRGVVQITRTGLVILRAVPEYIWAFLFLALFGANAWPMILALALHNTGILGKLSAELIENQNTGSCRALRGAGASRFQIILGTVLPVNLSRFLLYFFYRWETCIREATVLGMLGMSSLGLLIVDGRARNHYDEMLYYILLGALLVLSGDFLSAMMRRFVRKA